LSRLVDSPPDWSRSWASLGEISARAGSQNGELLHLQDSSHCGLTICYSLPLSWQRAEIIGSQAGLDAIGVGLVLEGGITASVGESQLACGANDGFVFDLSKDIKFVDDFLTTTKICILWLPRIRLRLASLHLTRGVKFTGATLAGAVLAATLRTLADRSVETEAPELGSLAFGLAAMAAAAVQASVAHEVKWGREAKVGAILKFIDANLTSSLLEPDRVAAQFGLSRASLYRLFDPLGGVAGYIRERRLQRAMEELTARGSPSRSIAAVGRKMGYPDAASFARAFRAQFGMTPSAIIKTRAKPTSALPAVIPQPRKTTSTLADLLQDLSSRQR